MPSTSGEGTHTGEMSWASIALAILAASFLSFLEAESAADLGIFETAALPGAFRAYKPLLL